MQVIYIYCVTNLVNNKRYVGQTRYLPQERFRGHCSDAKARSSRRGLARAIRKYGEKSFVVEQLCSVEDQESANTVEKNLISRFDCLSNGYNMLPGGAGKRSVGNPHTKTAEWKKKMSDLRKEKWKDPESRQRMISGRWDGKIKKPSYLPAKLSKEQISSAIAKSNSKRSKTYHFISPNGETVTVNHLPSFCKQNQLNSTCMCRVASGSYKTHKNWTKAT